MKTINEIIELDEILVDSMVIEEWVELGWIKPIKKKQTYYFEEIDIARIHLIYDLQHRMMIEHEVMPIILSLMDQLYGTRAKLNQLVAAIEKQPEQVREEILSLLYGGEN